MESVLSSETNDHPRAFLWIPPSCKQVRAVVVGQHNMMEEGILEHPSFRKALADMNMAEVWVTPAFDGNFNYDKGAGEHFDEMMKALADVSGYQELAFAPVVPIGHSAMAGFPYNFAMWNPGRTLAAISCKGQWPDSHDEKAGPSWAGRSYKDAPLLQVSGEYEWADEREGFALRHRNAHPESPFTMLADPGSGHFDSHDKLVAYLGFYLRKVSQYRLPNEMPLDRPADLKHIDATKEGWLIDRWRINKEPMAPAAPVGKYTGNVNETMWCFDEEHAKATETYQAEYRGKKADLLGYVQDGQIAPNVKTTHQQVTLKFEPVDDGMTFKLVGAFLDTVPDGRPVRWTGLKVGAAIGHAEGGVPIVISRICGPVVKESDDTFAIRFYRMGMNNKMRSNDIWLMATHPGDDQYKRAVQQSEFRFPLHNDQGSEQTITFPAVADQVSGASSIQLGATSDANVPVYYYVREGPAEVDDGGKLSFTAIPPRAKFPVKVTVVAWQWGRSIEPRMKTATPVERTFAITAGK